MKKNTIKNTVLVGLFIILAPLILVGVTALGNSLGGKAKDKVVQTTEQTAKVPEETKAESNKDIPKANDSKVTEENTNKKESSTNEKENGEKIIANMDNRLKALQNKIAKKYKGPKPRILMYTTFGSTSGKNTTFDDMVRLINGINVISEAGINKYQDISKEKIIELNPDIIIVPIAKKYDNVAKVSKLFFEDPSLKNVKAVKNKKVYFVQYKDISATSQYMIDNIENLAKNG